MADKPEPPKPGLTPLAIITPDKPISDMTYEELDALGDKLFDGMNATRKPAKD